jgi:murein DD-endopeptidase MepM/ murein hydrolase activator NlpD
MAKPIPGAVVTCDYDDPSGCAAGECGFHTGRDYRADIGTPVHASKAGKVVFAGAHTPAPGDDWGPAYGTQVIIDTSGIRHLYAHLSKASVAKDQLVKAGDQVGLSGDTGNTHGPHLHYEERVHPYDHCPNNREPQFDKGPETEDMTPAQEAKLDDLINRVRLLQQRTIVNDEGESIEIDLAVERLLKLVRREFTPEP